VIYAAGRAIFLLHLFNFQNSENMIKKIKYGLITLLILITTNSYGQNGFLSANHSYQIDGNEFTLFSETSFSFGYASTCPRLDTFIVSTDNNIISIDLFFDLRGAWPQAGCTSYDTSSFLINTNYNAILANINTIEYGASINDSVINKVQADTLVQNPLSLVETFLKYNIKIFPNPAKDIVQIEVSKEIQFESIELFDISGKKLKTFNASCRNLNISGLSSGVYFLSISTTKGGFVQKVVIE
jgi:hypothetical protein